MVCQGRHRRTFSACMSNHQIDQNLLAYLMAILPHATGMHYEHTTTVSMSGF